MLQPLDGLARSPGGEEDLTRARILLADDHKEMRDRIFCLLEPEFEVIGAVEDGSKLLTAEAELHPDVCVVDISMPSICGIDAAIKMKANGSKARVVLLTVYEDRDFLAAAIESGVAGYVVKSRMASDLCVAVRAALVGEQFISPIGQTRS